jgi:hypothetical protein
MISGLERILSKRIWFISDLQVWGLSNLGETEFAAVEQGGSSANIFFGTVGIGDGPQTVLFNQLTDHRGNNLPASIASPCVLIRPRTKDAVFIVGTESPTGFKIARDSDSTTPTLVDLMIIEMGN